MKPDSASGGDNESRNTEAWKILNGMGLKDVSFESDKESDFVAGLLDKF